MAARTVLRARCGGVAMTAMSVSSSGIGKSVPRREDARLTTGGGRYSDDWRFEGQAFAVMVRSPHAHARIRSVDARAAMTCPGVIAVLTGADARADGLGPIPHTPFGLGTADIPMANSDGTPYRVVPHQVIAHDKARFGGEVVAMVLADSVSQARDAAERVEVEYEVLPAVTDTLEALRADAPRVDDAAPSNVCLDAVLGDEAATRAAFARAAHVVHFETQVQRVTAMPLEPRASTGLFDAATGQYTLYACSSGAVRLRNDLATVLGVTPDRVRVVIGDVGGHFGARGMITPECVLTAWAARRIGRPVKWTCERHEAFVSDYQGRDLAVSADLALDAEGRFLAMRGSNVGNLGACTGNFQPLQKGVEIMSSLYRVPVVHFRARAVVSNTPPTRPYRSAGRPEVMYVMERLIDLAARECGFDRVELRRCNLIAPHELPYRNPFGMVYDNGNYADAMEQALALGDWAGFETRRAAARANGRWLGIGVANYVDTATGAPRERAEVTVCPEGRIEVVIGTVSTGQGHDTTFAQLISEWLGVPLDEVVIRTGDTAFVSVGGGTHSGRGMRQASIVIWNASREIIERGTQLAARLLECSAADVRFEAGRFHLSGTDRAVALYEVARAAQAMPGPTDAAPAALAAVSDIVNDTAAYPYGAHVCEVAVDGETGVVSIERYTAVDDVGRAVNPMIVDGQTHGGIVQGVGQALMEHCVHDPDSGQLLAGSFLDYPMPRADGFPSFQTCISEVPSSSHPLGIRPGGEGGTTPALGVVINAVVDALAHLGVRHVEMPATGQRVFSAIQAARQATGQEVR